MKNSGAFGLRFVLATAALALVLAGPFASTAQAFFSTLDTADLLKQGEYDLGIEPEYIFSRYTGGNVIGHFDMGANENSNLKFVLGSGSTSFQTGAFYKMVPIPDYENQPGVGFFAGVHYAVKDNVGILSFRVHPLISKQFVTPEVGNFTPYLSIPFGMSMGGGSTTYPVQVEMGTKWLPPGAQHTNVFAELGFEVNASFSYISLGLVVPFDSWDNIKFD